MELHSAYFSLIMVSKQGFLFTPCIHNMKTTCTRHFETSFLSISMSNVIFIKLISKLKAESTNKSHSVYQYNIWSAVKFERRHNLQINYIILDVQHFY